MKSEVVLKSGSYCRICKKPLRDLTSVKLGIGPVCRGHHGIDGNGGQVDMFENHAVFSIMEETDCFLYIIDCGNHSECKTVTNDVGFVLSELSNSIDKFDNKRLFYKDSYGNIDEIIHSGKTFIGFKSGHSGVTL